MTRLMRPGLHMEHKLSGGRIYASDMINGIWELAPAPFPPG